MQVVVGYLGGLKEGGKTYKMVLLLRSSILYVEFINFNINFNYKSKKTIRSLLSNGIETYNLIRIVFFDLYLKQQLFNC